MCRHISLESSGQRAPRVFLFRAEQSARLDSRKKYRGGETPQYEKQHVFSFSYYLLVLLLVKEHHIPKDKACGSRYNILSLLTTAANTTQQIQHSESAKPSVRWSLLNLNRHPTPTPRSLAETWWYLCHHKHYHVLLHLETEKRHQKHHQTENRVVFV